ncbi:hypothetical protein D3C76_1223520 [compost metagenome]
MGAAHIQRHAVSAGFFIVINVLITVGQAGERRNYHIGWQFHWIAKLRLQRHRLAVEFALRSAGEAGKVSATNRAVVLTVHTGRKIEIPRIARVSGVTDDAVVVGGRSIAAQVAFPVDRSVAVVHGCTQTPVVTQRTVSTQNQAAKFRRVTADVCAAVLTRIPAKRLSPDDPVAGIVITGCHAAGARGVRITHGINVRADHRLCGRRCDCCR